MRVKDFLIPLLLGLLIGLAGSAFGEEPGVGQDLLGLQHEEFPVDDLALLVPEGFVGGHLDWTFGTKLTNVKKVLDTKKVAKWRVHFLNGPGLRNGQLGAYEPMFGMTKEGFNAIWEKGGGKLRDHLRTRVKLYCNLFDNYPAVALEMSPTLEHNLSSKAFREQASVIKRNCPRAVIVDNPGLGVASTKGYKTERHGVKVRGLKAPCNVSLDGDEAFDADMGKFLAENAGCTKYIWSLTYNGRSAKGEFVDPRKRTRWPTKEQLRTLLLYAEGGLMTPAAVAGCKPTVDLPRLWKVSSDDHQVAGDDRANKPLWLSPVKALAVRVYTAVGNRDVASLVYYGPFDGGGYRYYSGTGSNLYGIEMAEDALVLSGSPYVVLREPGTDGRCYGPFHPAYRHDSYR